MSEALSKVDIAVLVSVVETLSRDVRMLSEDIKRLGQRFERVENKINEQGLTLYKQAQFFAVVDNLLRQGKA